MTGRKERMSQIGKWLAERIPINAVELAELTNVMGVVLNKSHYAGGVYGYGYGYD